VIEKIYETDGDRIQANRILDFIEKSGNKETTKVTVAESLWKDERYARATIVNILLMTFRTMSGFSGIMLYSNSIFEKA